MKNTDRIEITENLLISLGLKRSPLGNNKKSFRKESLFVVFYSDINGWAANLIPVTYLDEVIDQLVISSEKMGRKNLIKRMNNLSD